MHTRKNSNRLENREFELPKGPEFHYSSGSTFSRITPRLHGVALGAAILLRKPNREPAFSSESIHRGFSEERLNFLYAPVTRVYVNKRVRSLE